MLESTPFDRDLYMLAWKFAATHHGTQKVPGSELPYVVHVGAVAMEVIATLAVEAVARPNLAVACALLHDVVEDTGVQLAEIAATFDVFDPAISAGVAALTKDPSREKPDAMTDSLKRIRALGLREVTMVKLADRTVNMEPPPAHWSADKRRRYLEEAQTIRAELGDASPTLAARLGDKIGRYARFLDA